MVVQPAPLWSDYDLMLEAKSTSTTALSNSILRESEAFDFSVSRMPWGDTVRMRGEGIQQDESFVLSTLPTSNLVYAPVSISLLTIVGLIGAFAMGLALTKSRRRTYLLSLIHI